MVALLIWLVYPLPPSLFLHFPPLLTLDKGQCHALIGRLFCVFPALFLFCFLLHLWPLYSEVQWVSSKYSQSSYARQLASLARAHDCLLISSTGPDDDVDDVSPSLSSSPLPPRILCGHKFLILRFFACFDIISSGHGRCCFYALHLYGY